MSSHFAIKPIFLVTVLAMGMAIPLYPACAPLFKNSHARRVLAAVVIGSILWQWAFGSRSAGTQSHSPQPPHPALKIIKPTAKQADVSSTPPVVTHVPQYQRQEPVQISPSPQLQDPPVGHQKPTCDSKTDPRHVAQVPVYPTLKSIMPVKPTPNAQAPSAQKVLTAEQETILKLLEPYIPTIRTTVTPQALADLVKDYRYSLQRQSVHKRILGRLFTVSCSKITTYAELSKNPAAAEIMGWNTLYIMALNIVHSQERTVAFVNSITADKLQALGTLGIIVNSPGKTQLDIFMGPITKLAIILPLSAKEAVIKILLPYLPFIVESAQQQTRAFDALAALYQEKVINCPWHKLSHKQIAGMLLSKAQEQNLITPKDHTALPVRQALLGWYAIYTLAIDAFSNDVAEQFANSIDQKIVHELGKHDFVYYGHARYKQNFIQHLTRLGIKLPGADLSDTGIRIVAFDPAQPQAWLSNAKQVIWYPYVAHADDLAVLIPNGELLTADIDQTSPATTMQSALRPLMDVHATLHQPAILHVLAEGDTRHVVVRIKPEVIVARQPVKVKIGPSTNPEQLVTVEIIPVVGPTYPAQRSAEDPLGSIVPPELAHHLARAEPTDQVWQDISEHRFVNRRMPLQIRSELALLNGGRGGVPVYAQRQIKNPDGLAQQEAKKD